MMAREVKDQLAATVAREKFSIIAAEDAALSTSSIFRSNNGVL